MTTTTKPRRATRPNLPTNPSDRAVFFARGITLAEFRPRDARALDQADFKDRHPNQAPRRLGNIAAEVVGDVGEAALGHWLREAARTNGEEHKVALGIAQEIAEMIGVPWAEVLSEQAA